jgi:hypothetical protein
MEWKELLLDGYGRIVKELEGILQGLSKHDLDWQPDPQCNSIGWTIWHMTRGQDAQIADLAGKEQIYLKEKWYEKFSRPADPKDTGFGDTAQQVGAFRSPLRTVLLGYLGATTEQSKSYINSIGPADLDRVLNEPWFTPLPTVGVRLVSILADGHHHTGEASYIRGLQKALRKK